MEAPTAEEIGRNPTVQAAFAAAWADSFPDDAELRHEEGGFIYMHETSGAFAIRRVVPGLESEIDLNTPLELQNHYVVATFHTHPNPTELGWSPEPSTQERRFAKRVGLPGFVIHDSGIIAFGPIRRIGGLAGSRIFPILPRG